MSSDERRARCFDTATHAKDIVDPEGILHHRFDVERPALVFGPRASFFAKFLVETDARGRPLRWRKGALFSDAEARTDLAAKTSITTDGHRGASLVEAKFLHVRSNERGRVADTATFAATVHEPGGLIKNFRAIQVRHLSATATRMQTECSKLAIDSRTVGLDGKDQMDIKSLVTRQSYLTQFTWSPSTAADTMLWNTRVGPALYRDNGDEIHPTPMAMVQNLFEKWQGTMKFRFQVVKSAFHKGRLLIRWDPNVTSAGIQYNTVYSRVIDIAEEDDFELEVGWGQSEPFLNTSYLSSTAPQAFGTGKLLYSSLSKWNGILDVVVLNPLVSPAADANIQINVFVSMCDDAKFGAPTSEGIKNLSLFKGDNLAPQSGYRPQSGVVADPISADTDKPTETSKIAPIAPVMSITDKQMQVFFGESPKSLRELFRRYVYTQMYQTSPSATEFRLWTLTTSALPDQYGWDPTGPSNYTTTSGTNPATLCQMTPLSFMIGCYAGWRGSLRKKFMFWGGARYPIVSRAGFVPSVDTTTDLGASEASMQLGASRLFATKGFNGIASQDMNNNGVVECEVPYYIGKRMSPARIPAYNFNNGAECITVESLLNTNNATINAQVRIFEHCATGEDFSLFFFVGCPIFYEYNLS